MLESGTTEAELAALLGVSPSAIAHLLSESEARAAEVAGAFSGVRKLAWAAASTEERQRWKELSPDDLRTLAARGRLPRKP
jgi:hypothetical protein